MPAFRCACLNVCLHLTDRPSGDLPPALLSRVKGGERFLRAELGLGGETRQVPQLVASQTISVVGGGAAPQYRLLSCLNCGQDLYLQPTAAGPSQEIFVNRELVECSAQADASLRSSPAYSPVFGIILEANQEAENALLEVPEGATDAFMALQARVEEVVAREVRRTEEELRRIEAELRERLREFQARAYRDRKVLWSRLAPHLSRPAAAASQRPLTIGRNKSPRSSSLPEPAAPPSGSSSARPPPVAATSPAAGIAAAAGAPLAAPAETAGPTAPAGAAGDLIRTSAPQPTQQPSGASHALDSSTAQQEASVITVFVLEEDSESQSEPVLHATEDEEPLERAAVVSLEFPAASSARHEEEPVSGGGGAGAGAALFGTSVPISIPPSRSLYSSRLSDISAPAVLPADQLDQATSFDVPLSSTRRIKGYL